MKKILLILTALIVSAMTWAATDDLLCGGSFVGSFPNNESWIGSDVDYYSGNGYKFDQNETLQSPNLTDGVKKVTIKILVGYNGDATSTLKVGAYDSSKELLAETENIVPTVTYNNQTDAAIQTFTLDGMGTDIHFIKISFTKVKNYGMKTFEVYDATPPSMTLESVYIKGTATKLEYIVGESFDPAGLEVWGVYTKTVKNDTESQITSGITWTIDPEVLAKEDISVDVTAQYKDFTSEVFTVNNIVVKEKPAAKYVPVAWNEIEDGGKYFITANNDGEYYFAAKAFAAKGALAIAFDAALAPEADMWTFTKNGDAWKISAADGAGLYMTNDNNGLVCAANKGADFTVAQGSSAEFTDLTASDGTNTRYVALYNQQDFRCYKTSSTSGIRDLKLYGLKKEGVVTKPTFTPAESEFDGSVEVTLTADEGAAIYYTLDGTSPVDNQGAELYAAPFKLTETTTVKAIASKGGKRSDVAEKTYTLIPAFESLEALVTNLPATETNKTVIVTITNAPIDSFYVSGQYTNGVYTHVGETVVELYQYNVPETWEVGGKVSGTIKAEWLLYKGTPELQKWEGGWEAFTYTAPSGPQVDKTGITVNGRKYGFPVRLVKEVPTK